jgi:hypothetical protein
MSVLKWIGYFLASLFVLSVVLGTGLFIGIAVLIVGICFCLVALVSFGAYCIKAAFETR